MIRATLQGCIDLYNSNIIMRTTAIRGMEQLGEWETASIYWRKLNRIDDANACDMIVNAIKAGDKIREQNKTI